MKKVYVNSKVIGEENYKRLIENFPNVQFSSKVEDSLDAEIIMNFPNSMNNDFLMKFPNLKWIQLFSSGYNMLGTYAMDRSDIQITNARDVHSIPIAEDIILKILLINRNVLKYHDNMKNGLWLQNQNEIELSKSTVGFIGTGSIAQETAKRLKAFNVKTIGYKRTKEDVDYFDEIYTGENGLMKVLSVSDYLILALPLNDESYHLINKEKLSLMKTSSVLVNISRGDIINEDDLVAALKSKTIRAAALDVASIEPLPKTSPLWSIDNVFITPHNAATSQYSFIRITDLLIENLDNYLKGNKLKNLITK